MNQNEDMPATTKRKARFTEDDLERLIEIQDELLDLLGEARELIQRRGGLAYERAKVYWLAHIETALKNDHQYLGGSMTTMEDTLAELAEETMTKLNFDKMTIYRFRCSERAFSFADGALKMMMVILGDDERYWVVTMADGERLLRAGYEAAPRIG